MHGTPLLLPYQKFTNIGPHRSGMMTISCQNCDVRKHEGSDITEETTTMAGAEEDTKEKGTGDESIHQQPYSTSVNHLSFQKSGRNSNSARMRRTNSRRRTTLINKSVPASRQRPPQIY
ncbi:Hypothetical protein NTJ_06346 [Nesidiocoris tenuis]|uniref:Uncharacterized protein n=1 Tax=Nesidiocoris tenuis TaxID=355587 RepID=A0ABN7AMS2_9HEMI|nr:Hypothetical protein NTJ_06346 [Nesidiocoris tenuis]